MLSVKGFVSRHWLGSGGIRELLGIALPMIVAQASSSLMMVTDRYLLTALGKVYPVAALAGSFFAVSCSLFFIGLLSYITPLVAQYVGAKKKHVCLDVLAQGVLFSVVVSPVVLTLGAWLAPMYFVFAKLPQQEVALAYEYLKVVLAGSVFVFLNVSFSSYFSGLGKSSVVMIVNLMSLLVNAPLTYYLIHQSALPGWSGISGAAAGTVLSGMLGSLCFLGFLLKDRQLSGLLRRIRHPNFEILKKLTSFGAPTGLEFFLGFFAFNLAVMLFHSYGESEGLAITIALNWDLLAVLPFWGLSTGLMSLAGRYLGSRQVDFAKRATYSGVKVGLVTAILYTLMFCFFREGMVQIFLPEGLSSSDSSYIMILTKKMLAWGAVYIFVHAIGLVFGALLRASGDTRWFMFATITADWTCCFLVFLSIRIYEFEPLTTWAIFILNFILYALVIVARFKSDRWQTHQVV